MRKCDKRKLGEEKQRQNLLDSIRSGLEAQKSDHKRRQEKKRRLEEEAAREKAALEEINAALQIEKEMADG